MKHIYVFSGMSGVGKTSIINELTKEGEYIYPIMYTTRPMRRKVNDGKIQVDDIQYEKLPGKLVEFVFNNFKYTITDKEIQHANIFDLAPSGFKSLKKNYSGDKKIIIIYLWVNEQERIRRMLKRGESEAEIKQRIQYEKKEYRDVEKSVDFMVENRDLETSIKKVRAIITICEKLL